MTAWRVAGGIMVSNTRLSGDEQHVFKGTERMMR